MFWIHLLSLQATGARTLVGAFFYAMRRWGAAYVNPGSPAMKDTLPTFLAAVMTLVGIALKQ